MGLRYRGAENDPMVLCAPRADYSGVDRIEQLPAVPRNDEQFCNRLVSAWSAQGCQATSCSVAVTSTVFCLTILLCMCGKCSLGIERSFIGRRSSEVATIQLLLGYTFQVR